jgi:hypothetical protein
MEIFLYEWWPLLRPGRTYEKMVSVAKWAGGRSREARLENPHSLAEAEAI